jgi:hypothetical protein
MIGIGGYFKYIRPRLKKHFILIGIISIVSNNSTHNLHIV